MTHRQIEQSREVRLWISQIIVPAVGIAVAALNIPEVRQAASTKVNKIRESIKRKKEQNIKG